MKDESIGKVYFDIDIPIKKDILIRALSKNIAINSNNIRNNNKSNKKKNKKRVVLTCLFVLFLLVFGISLFKVVKWYFDSRSTNNAIKEIENIVQVEEVIEDDKEVSVELVNEPSEEVVSDYWYYVKFPLIQVDFNDLLKKNSDTVAWIQVNNTNINYPVVQTKDNDYYLTRSYDKSWNEAGWVFMDYRNSNNLSDKNTIIYAHSRLDKTMFGSLSKVLREDWYKNKDNHVIKISTMGENSLWQIFSVYKIETEDYYITTEFGSDTDYMNFLDTIKNRSKYNFNVSLSSNDSIITLSTCFSDTERTVVHAKKIKKSTRIS